jgi:hypothetical protein
MADQQQSCLDVAPAAEKIPVSQPGARYKEPEPLKRSVRGLITLRNGARIIRKFGRRMTD